MLCISVSYGFDSFIGVSKSHIGGDDMAELSIGMLLDSLLRNAVILHYQEQNTSVGVTLIADGFSKQIYEVY